MYVWITTEAVDMGYTYIHYFNPAFNLVDLSTMAEGPEHQHVTEIFSVRKFLYICLKTSAIFSLFFWQWSTDQVITANSMCKISKLWCLTCLTWQHLLEDTCTLRKSIQVVFDLWTQLLLTERTRLDRVVTWSMQ